MLEKGRGEEGEGERGAGVGVGGRRIKRGKREKRRGEMRGVHVSRKK